MASGSVVEFTLVSSVVLVVGPRPNVTTGTSCNTVGESYPVASFDLNGPAAAREEIERMGFGSVNGLARV